MRTSRRCSSRDSGRILALAIWTSACAQSVVPRPSGADPIVLSRSDWTQVWSDEFDGAAGTSFDATKWGPDLGDGCPGICGWGNSEKEYYTASPDNVSLDGSGRLQLVARQAPTGLSCYYGPCRYTSAKITTRDKMSAEPGLVEARIKVPAGQGLWPAFWMLGADFPATGWPQCGELDIMEFKGSKPTTMSSAIHGQGYSGARAFFQEKTLVQGSFSSDFHTFAVAWDSQRARFFVDDTLHFEIRRTNVELAGTWAFDKSFFVILNLAVGGHFDGDPQSDAILPATMLVDYVRVYRPVP